MVMSACQTLSGGDRDPCTKHLIATARSTGEAKSRFCRYTRELNTACTARRQPLATRRSQHTPPHLAHNCETSTPVKTRRHNTPNVFLVPVELPGIIRKHADDALREKRSRRNHSQRRLPHGHNCRLCRVKSFGGVRRRRR